MKLAVILTAILAVIILSSLFIFAIKIIKEEDKNESNK